MVLLARAFLTFLKMPPELLSDFVLWGTQEVRNRSKIRRTTC